MCCSYSLASRTCPPLRPYPPLRQTCAGVETSETLGCGAPNASPDEYPTAAAHERPSPGAGSHADHARRAFETPVDGARTLVTGCRSPESSNARPTSPPTNRAGRRAGRFIGPCINSQPHALTKSRFTSFTWYVLGVIQAPLHPTRRVHCTHRLAAGQHERGHACKHSFQRCDAECHFVMRDPTRPWRGFVGAETPAVASSVAKPLPLSEGAAGVIPDAAPALRPVRSAAWRRSCTL